MGGGRWLMYIGSRKVAVLLIFCMGFVYSYIVNGCWKFTYMWGIEELGVGIRGMFGFVCFLGKFGKENDFASDSDICFGFVLDTNIS